MILYVDGLVVVSSLTVIAVGKVFFELFEDIFFIPLHIFLGLRYFFEIW